jgi:hypothetical protein
LLWSKLPLTAIPEYLLTFPGIAFGRKLEAFEMVFVQSVVCIAMSSHAGNVH